MRVFDRFSHIIHIPTLIACSSSRLESINVLLIITLVPTFLANKHYEENHGRSTPPPTIDLVSSLHRPSIIQVSIGYHLHQQPPRPSPMTTSSTMTNSPFDTFTGSNADTYFVKAKGGVRYHSVTSFAFHLAITFFSNSTLCHFVDPIETSYLSIATIVTFSSYTSLLS